MAEARMDDNERAIASLEALAKIPGALRVITNEVRPELREDRKEARSAAKEDVDLRDHATFVIHDVVAIEGPNEKGCYTATTAEGDWCMGYPVDLLNRLTEASR